MHGQIPRRVTVAALLAIALIVGLLFLLGQGRPKAFAARDIVALREQLETVVDRNPIPPHSTPCRVEYKRSAGSDLYVPARDRDEFHPLEARSASVVATVRWERNGAPAADIRVFLADRSRTEPMSMRTDGVGRVTFRGLRSGATAVTADRGGYMSFVLEPGEKKSVSLEIPRGETVRVRVTDEAGVAVSGASVFLSYRISDKWGGIVAATGSDGTCEIQDIEECRLVWVQAPGFEPSFVQPVFDSRELPFVLRRRGGVIQGHVMDARDGSSIPGALIRADGYVRAGSVVLPDGSTRSYPPPASPVTTSDENGDFRFLPNLRSGLQVVASADGFAEKRIRLDRQALDAGIIELALEPSDGVFGFLEDSAGAAFGFAQLWLDAEEEGIRIDAQAQPDGSFWIPGVPNGPATVHAYAPGGYVGNSRVTVVRGRAPILHLELSNADAIRFQAQTASGAPAVDCPLVLVYEPHSSPAFLTMRDIGRTDEKGVCFVAPERLEDGATVGLLLGGVERSLPYRTVVWTRDMHAVRFELGNAPEGSALRFEWLEKSGTIENPAPFDLFVREEADVRWLARRLEKGGAIAFEGLAAGRYVAVVAHQGEWRSLGVLELGAGEVLRIPCGPGNFLRLHPTTLDARTGAHSDRTDR